MLQVTNHLMSAIDELGAIKAQIASLQKIERELKAVLVEQGPGAYEGSMFRATVSESQREVLDLDAVREKLSPQFLRAHTSFTEVTTVRVMARKVA